LDANAYNVNWGEGTKEGGGFWGGGEEYYTARSNRQTDRVSRFKVEDQDQDQDQDHTTEEA
jgi:hypothetical protein